MELDGLKLLLPLTQSKDVEVQRLAAHALANLSVNGAVGWASPLARDQLTLGLDPPPQRTTSA